MGARKSRYFLDESKTASAVGTHAKSPEHHEIENNMNCELEAHQKASEQQYVLQLKHATLQDRFLDLKSKFESDELSSGDFSNRVSHLNRKLNEALSEKGFMKIDSEKRIEILRSNENRLQNVNEMQDLRLKLQLEKVTSKEAIQCLEIEEKDTLNKPTEINLALEMENESNGMQSKMKMNIMEIEQKYYEETLVSRVHNEEERANVNKQWELKLNEILRNCDEELNKVKLLVAKENSNLQGKLNIAITDMDSLSRKYKLLNNLFEEIRSRYERRESRKEDLERIADLEGQLLIQSEEIERQRYILKTLKYPASQINNEVNKKRNRRNAKSKRQKLDMASSGNDIGFGANMKSVQQRLALHQK